MPADVALTPPEDEGSNAVDLSSNDGGNQPPVDGTMHQLSDQLMQEDGAGSQNFSFHTTAEFPALENAYFQSDFAADHFRAPDVAATNGDQARSSRQHKSFIGASGYIDIFTSDPPGSALSSSSQFLPIDDIPIELQQAHVDSFIQYAYTWCPVFDRAGFETDHALNESLLLRHALAVCGNQIKSPLMEHTSCREHYQRTKKLLYEEQDDHPMVCIMAMMLLYWWSAVPPTVVSHDTVDWWTSAAIKMAHQIGLHSNSSPHYLPLASETPGLRRRIWWTLVVSYFVGGLTSMFLADS